MSSVKVAQFRVGESNYNYIIYNPESKKGIVVDPLDAKPVLEKVRDLGVSISHIINTHGHSDHIAGNSRVKKETGAILIGPAKEGIEGVDQTLDHNQELKVDGIHVQAFFMPGHTPGHISLLVNNEHLLVGDILFLGGCGNCKFGGNPDQLFESLQELMKLPDHLKIYVGHEYALKNLEFGKTYDPQNQAIVQMLEKVEKTLASGEAPLTTLGEEKIHNVFLRSGHPDVMKPLKKKFPKVSEDPRSIFKKLRELRNSF